MTQEGLAHAAGITKNHVQLLEAGRGSAQDPHVPSNPQMATMYGIADALQVIPDVILFDVDRVEEPKNAISASDRHVVNIVEGRQA